MNPWNLHRSEHLRLEVRFLPASQTALLFFDHYAKQFMSQKSDLDHYFAKLGAEGWKLTGYDTQGETKLYMFRRPKN